MKNLFIIVTVLICSITLFGCATTYDRGNGVVLSVKKIQDKDFKPHEVTKTGAAVGGVTGAVGGAAAGGLAGLIFGVAETSGSMVIATTFGGALVGALIVGGIGAAAGGGIGYVVDVARPDVAVYQFVVQPEDGKKPITITQHSTRIPVDSQVHILENDGTVYIKKE